MIRSSTALAALVLIAAPAAASAGPCAEHSCHFTLKARPGSVTRHQTRQRFAADDVVRFDLAVGGRALVGRSYGSGGCRIEYTGPGVLVRVNSCRSRIRVRATTLRTAPVRIRAAYRSVVPAA